EYRTKTFEDTITWLGTKSRPWLMIMDNVDDPAMDLFPLIPKSRYGHLIITSRDSTRLGLAGQSNRHPIHELEQEAAIELLLHLSSCSASDSNIQLASNIAAELGYLPLALVHAGAYISIHGSMSSYLETHRKCRKEMLEHLPPSLPSDYNFAVATTIEMSFGKLPQQSRDILHLLSQFQIGSIAESIIVKAGEREFIHQAWPSPIDPIGEIQQCADALMKIFCPNGRWSRHDFDQIICSCLQSSLLQTGESERMGRHFSMHPLVRSWIRIHNENDVEPSIHDVFIRLISSSIMIGKEYEYLEFNQTLRPHLQSIDEKDVRYIGDKHAFERVLYENGDYSLGLGHVESCLDQETETLGERDISTVQSIHRVSIYYSKVGKYTKALEIGLKVMELRQMILGSEHPETLRSMHNLSIWYSEVGRYGEALEMGLKVMELRQKILGSEHPDTLMSMDNLSIRYSEVGRYSEALEMGLKAMELYQKILGSKHPDTLR
ncbi:4045_t:CDS:1, partial [Acaulospora colombiana]